jgi:hypothetical protein
VGTLKGNAERKKAILQMTDVANGIDDTMGRQMTFLQTSKFLTIVENFSVSDGCYILGFWVITVCQLFPSSLVLVILISNSGWYQTWVCSTSPLINKVHQDQCNCMRRTYPPCERDHQYSLMFPL